VAGPRRVRIERAERQDLHALRPRERVRCPLIRNRLLCRLDGSYRPTACPESLDFPVPAGACQT
jgi:hypothetical protein